MNRREGEPTEWILLTSAPPARPNSSCTPAQSRRRTADQAPVRHGLEHFYDIRRYGGLQIYLRAVLSGSLLVLSSSGEPMLDFCNAPLRPESRTSQAPVPLRRVLMSGEAARLKPQYVRSSGEVADQACWTTFARSIPMLASHTPLHRRSGVAFDVNDGLAGFPLEFINNPSAEIELKVVDHTCGFAPAAMPPLLGCNARRSRERRWLCRYRRHDRVG